MWGGVQVEYGTARSSRMASNAMGACALHHSYQPQREVRHCRGRCAGPRTLHNNTGTDEDARRVTLLLAGSTSCAATLSQTQFSRNQRASGSSEAVFGPLAGEPTQLSTQPS